MKMTDEEIQNRIAEIVADGRLSQETATVFVNAPLALVQMSMSAELHTLQKVLGVPLTKIKDLQNQKIKS